MASNTSHESTPELGDPPGLSRNLRVNIAAEVREARKSRAVKIAKAMFKQKLARKWGHAIARGWATLLLGRLRDFVVAPSSGGGNSSPLHDSQGVDELATLDRYHHFHGHSGLCA